MAWPQKSIRIAFLAGLIFAIALNLFYRLHPGIIGALSKNFTQNDWSGGADTNSTVNGSSGTWTKYYSANTGITAVSGVGLKLKVEQTP